MAAARTFGLSAKDRIQALSLIDDNGCWIWQANISKVGYGRIGIRSFQRTTNKLAHRVSYEEFRGTIPDGLQIDHLCKVRSCVNPKHLEAVTPKENINRSDALWKQELRRTRCPQGHDYSKENTYERVTRIGGIGRMCKACGTAKQKMRWQLKKLARGIA